MILEYALQVEVGGQQTQDVTTVMHGYARASNKPHINF